MATSWDPVLLPPGYAYGFSGGPAFDTRITETDDGGEFRVQTLEEPKWRWQALRKNFTPDADVDGLIDWFLARRGPLYGFLYLDPREETHSAASRWPTWCRRVEGRTAIRYSDLPAALHDVRSSDARRHQGFPRDRSDRLHAANEEARRSGAERSAGH
jgi:hypothetical protein